MVVAARELLAAVTRLLCVADMVDVEEILQLIIDLQGHLKHIEGVDEIKEFLNSFNLYGGDLHQLLKKAAHRQGDLKTQVSGRSRFF